MENTNIPKIIILLLISPFIILFLLFAFGLSKVDAQSLQFNRANNIGFATNQANVLAGTWTTKCGNAITCGILNDTESFDTHLLASYSIGSNITNSSITSLPTGNYSLSMTSTIQSVGLITSSQIDVDIVVYRTSTKKYSVATCDTNETINKNKFPDSSNRWEISYNCGVLENNLSDVTFVGLMYSVPTINYIYISSSLKIIGEGEATNSDIINNQNQNTQDIINNQNQNTQDIIDNNNSNTDKITDAIEESNKQQQETNDFLKDKTNPDLSSFDNYAGWLPPGPLDSILILPLSLLNNLTNLFSTGTCSGITLPIPYLNKNLELPCLTSIYSQINGLNIAINTLFLPIVGYFFFKYLSSLYVWVENTLMLKDSNYMSKWGGV